MAKSKLPAHDGSVALRQLNPIRKTGPKRVFFSFFKNIAKVLRNDKKLWVKRQNILHEEKSNRDAEKAYHHLLYIQNLSNPRSIEVHSFLQRRLINA